MRAALGWGRGEEIYDQIVYGSILLDAPLEQQTTMFVGSDDAVKVWLNGELVHQALVTRGSDDYQDFFSVTLKQGRNALLVAVDNHGGAFCGFFGFAPDAKYALFHPSLNFSFSTDATDFEVGDTFTLQLEAANADDLAGWQASLTFNPAVLEATRVLEGDFLKQDNGETFFQEGTIQNRVGKISGLKSLELSRGKRLPLGTLLSVDFTVIGKGNSRVTLEDFQAGTRWSGTLHVIPPVLNILVGSQDVNGDGLVNILDLTLIAARFGQRGAENPADINGDGFVNVADLVLVAGALGGDAAGAPAVQAHTSTLTAAAVQQWLVQAQAMQPNSTDAKYQRGILFLQRLLTALTPEETAVLPNYPNPFNPETWIPYQLAEPAEVSVSIYAASGQLVRRLDFGYQPAGVYHIRSRAAYWDGRNSRGERVASGVYFYTFTAGDFTATWKMLVVK